MLGRSRIFDYKTRRLMRIPARSSHEEPAPPATVFDPATLALTGWWRDYAEPPPWSGTASAGASGSHHFVTAGSDPTNGTALNGHIPAAFDAASSQDLRDLIDPASSFVAVDGYTIVALINAASAEADPGVGAPYSAPMIWGDSLRRVGMSFTDAGLVAWHFDGTDWTSLQVACGTGAPHLLQMKYDGTTQKARVDSGSFSSQLRDNVEADLSGLPFMAKNFGSTVFFDGAIYEVMVIDSALSDADLDNIKSYINDRHGLSL